MSLITRDGAGNLATLQTQVVSGEHALHHLIDYKLAVSVSPTITASSAYSAGNVIGGLLTFANAARVAGAGGILNSLVITDKANQGGQYDLWLFDSDPSTGSTITDKTALTVAAAAILKSIGVISLSTWVVAGTGGAVAEARIDKRYIVSGTSLYGILITRGTPTYAGTSDVQVRLVLSRD